MSGYLTKIEAAIDAIDVTDLVVYSDKVNHISSLNKMMAPTYLRDFIVGQDVSNTLLSKAIEFSLKAEAAVKTAESIAFLDRAGDYLASKNIKESAEARKMYINLDPDVIKAKMLSAKSQALVAFLKGKCSEMRQAHDDVKKICYGETQQTAYEGF